MNFHKKQNLRQRRAPVLSALADVCAFEGGFSLQISECALERHADLFV